MTTGGEQEQVEEQGFLAGVVAWSREVAWEFDSREPSIRASQVHQVVRIVGWLLVALALARLAWLGWLIMADVQPPPADRLAADEDGIRTALFQVLGGVILVPAGLFLLWAAGRFLWNLSLDAVRRRSARILHPAVTGVVALSWSQLLMWSQGSLAVAVWGFLNAVQHKLELASKFSMGG